MNGEGIWFVHGDDYSRRQKGGKSVGSEDGLLREEECAIWRSLQNRYLEVIEQIFLDAVMPISARRGVMVSTTKQGSQ